MIGFVKNGAFSHMISRPPATLRVPSAIDDNGYVNMKWGRATPAQRMAAGYFDVVRVVPSFDPMVAHLSGETIEVKADHILVTSLATALNANQLASLAKQKAVSDMAATEAPDQIMRTVEDIVDALTLAGFDITGYLAKPSKDRLATRKITRGKLPARTIV